MSLIGKARGRGGRFVRGAARAFKGRKGMRGKRRRGRGITGPQLRGFHKVVRLLHKVGMQPKKLGKRRIAR